MTTLSAPRTLKVCGATSTRDIEVLAGAGACLVGLWHGVPGGPADLPEHEVAALAAAVRATGTLHPVLVTFLGDPDAVAGVLRRTGIRIVQLHAYQPPATVRALRTALPDTVIVKVLHVMDGSCPERPLIGAYERAGTDLFLIDSTTADGRVGSTGQRLDEETVLRLAQRFTLPFWLAGGLDRTNRSAYERVLSHPRLRGIDVDTAARGGDGRFGAPAVAGLARAWNTGPGHPDPRTPSATDIPTTRPTEQP
ncbi:MULTISPECIES: phosphoribosylanthranilate isomerase [unclassified Streptomyces]|uniref:phosphoribosylanthranilate isomerase n=1 Tax=unclassified Streptomyces TaxID=2593676 RepID=UPI000DAC5655|nr:MULTISPECIES: N-(5'-phosphoribosyl)anthranilate isomerase [unclassified Streptomyces]PZT71690.1 N-(5'-phosphoribosyl)anthranilate isomerase [Streptomyces sp. AC1-42T]PZT73183.1 N-(5'-phosphoribosyl)anthranilate isomerase [Streptomyces sp. AC1-42W]